MLAGYYWVMEYTSNKGLHFILSATWMGNVTRNLIGYPGTGRYLEADHGRGGLFSSVQAKDKYPVRIDHVIHYSDKSA